MLTRAGWGAAELGDLIHQTLGPYRTGCADNIIFSGPRARLPARQVVALILMLHELTTNAVKYGVLSTAEGGLRIEWSIDAQEAGRVVRLRWTESGGPPVQAPGRKGFGTALIERGIAHELDGRAELDYRPQGLVCELTFPLDTSADELLREAETSAEQLRSAFENRRVS